MITHELILKPLLYAIICIAIAIMFFIWKNNFVKKANHPVEGKKSASLFGWSFMVLGGFCLFISLFFLIAG
jgi:hypothetical protein